MSKFILIFAIYASSLVFTQRFSPLDAEIINLILRENQFELNELENDFEEITINVNCTAHQNMVIGQKGTFIFTTDYSDETLHIFDPDTIEQETSFITVMTDENGKSLNTSCRLWKPTEIIKIICDANFFEEGQHSVIINNQSFFMEIIKLILLFMEPLYSSKRIYIILFFIPMIRKLIYLKIYQYMN